MKTKAQNNEIPHIWANFPNYKGEYSEETSGTSLSIEGGTRLFSYRACIGQRASFKGKEFFAVSVGSYSVTTSKHQSMMRAAIPSGAMVVEVDTDCWTDSRLWHGKDGVCRFRNSVIDRHIQKAGKLQSQANRRRCEHRKIWDIEAANEELDKARSVAKFFGSKRKIPENATQCAKAIEEAEKREKARMERIRKKRMQQDIKRQLDWIKGGSSYPVYHLPVALRVKDGILETSQHATMPEKHAVRAYKAWKAGHNVIGEKVHAFTIQSVGDSFAQIGCHKVMISEIERIASEREWNA